MHMCGENDDEKKSSLFDWKPHRKEEKDDDVWSVRTHVQNIYASKKIFCANINDYHITHSCPLVKV